MFFLCNRGTNSITQQKSHYITQINSREDYMMYVYSITLHRLIPQKIIFLYVMFLVPTVKCTFDESPEFHAYISYMGKYCWHAGGMMCMYELRRWIPNNIPNLANMYPNISFYWQRPNVGACAIITKCLNNKSCTFKFLLSWRFPCKQRFWRIFLCASKARPPQMRKFYFYCLAVSENGRPKQGLKATLGNMYTIGQPASIT